MFSVINSYPVGKVFRASGITRVNVYGGVVRWSNLEATRREVSVRYTSIPHTFPRVSIKDKGRTTIPLLRYLV